MQIQLGDRVKDKVTGYTGIAICNLQYLNGCHRIMVQKEGGNKDGKIPEPEYFDIDQLTVTKADAVAMKPKSTGGPMPTQKGLPTPR